MTTRQNSILVVLCLIALAMTSSKRAPRRNRNRGQYRDSEIEDSQSDDLQGVCELEVSCKGGESLPLSLPIRGPRGPSGKPGTPGLPGKRGPPGVPGEAVRDMDEGCRVAFFVGLHKNAGPVKVDTDLKMDKIITNVGAAWNTETSRFTAPYNGTYSFSLTVAAQGRQRGAVEIVHNGQMVATVWAESIPFWASASNTVVLSLDADDQVWLILLERASYLHGYMYTSFSGHCLYRGL